MENTNTARAPGWFRVVAVLGLIWSLLGIAMYLLHLGVFGDPTAGMNEAEKALEASTPTWIMGTFGVATVAALLGTIGLVTRKRWAVPLLWVSLAAVTAQEIWIVFVSDAIAVHGSLGWIMPFVIFAIALALALVASHGARRGWLN